MCVGDASGLLDQEQRPAKRALAHMLILGEHGEELQGHAAGSQPWQPEVSEGIAQPALALVQHGEEQVVMGVGYPHPRSSQVVGRMLASRWG